MKENGAMQLCDDDLTAVSGGCAEKQGYAYERGDCFEDAADPYIRYVLTRDAAAGDFVVFDVIKYVRSTDSWRVIDHANGANDRFADEALYRPIGRFTDYSL